MLEWPDRCAECVAFCPGSIPVNFPVIDDGALTKGREFRGGIASPGKLFSDISARPIPSEACRAVQPPRTPRTGRALQLRFPKEDEYGYSPPAIPRSRDISLPGKIEADGGPSSFAVATNLSLKTRGRIFICIENYTPEAEGYLPLWKGAVILGMVDPDRGESGNISVWYVYGQRLCMLCDWNNFASRLISSGSADCGWFPRSAVAAIGPDAWWDSLPASIKDFNALTTICAFSVECCWADATAEAWDEKATQTVKRESALLEYINTPDALLPLVYRFFSKELPIVLNECDDEILNFARKHLRALRSPVDYHARSGAFTLAIQPCLNAIQLASLCSQLHCALSGAQDSGPKPDLIALGLRTDLVEHMLTSPAHALPEDVQTCLKKLVSLSQLYVLILSPLGCTMSQIRQSVLDDLWEEYMAYIADPRPVPSQCPLDSYIFVAVDKAMERAVSTAELYSARDSTAYRDSPRSEEDVIAPLKAYDVTSLAAHSDSRASTSLPTSTPRGQWGNLQADHAGVELVQADADSDADDLPEIVPHWKRQTRRWCDVEVQSPSRGMRVRAEHAALPKRVLL